MRYFFRRRVPDFARTLLIESGSRHIAENLLPKLYERPSLQKLDLLTCYAGLPREFRPQRGSVYRVTDYPGRRERARLVAELLANRYAIAVILCSGEPIMTKWKWLLAARLPVKILVVNENADYFWLDYSNWRIIRHFILFRAGLSGAGALATLGRLLVFPFTVGYLLLYTAIIHLRRKVRA
jgi:hypothetical protein